MGSKYKFKPDNNPPIGAYEASQALEKTLYRKDTYSYIAKSTISPLWIEKSPGPGDYENINKFGTNL